MLKEALQRLDLELAAEYFMSDFEYAIRDAFQSTFRDIEVKGCVFHYTKSILGRLPTTSLSVLSPLVTQSFQPLAGNFTTEREGLIGGRRILRSSSDTSRVNCSSPHIITMYSHFK